MSALHGIAALSDVDAHTTDNRCMRERTLAVHLHFHLVCREGNIIADVLGRGLRLNEYVHGIVSLLENTMIIYVHA